MFPYDKKGEFSMLIAWVCAIALAGALGICAAVDAFAGLTWLWLLPVCLFGSILLLAACWFLLLVIMAKAVDMTEDQDKDSLFYRGVTRLTIDALLPILKVHVEAQGLKQLPKDSRFLLVCNHLHDTDPIVLLWAFPKSQLGFISKRENDTKFLIGPFLRKLLCQPINRENDREALKTILNCIKLIKEDEISVGVFPEGYIRGDNLMHPFRSGVFKIAQKANVPVVVCTLQGTQHIYKNMKTWSPSFVKLHLVGVITPEEQQGRTAVDIAHEAYQMMAHDLGPDLVFSETAENT